MIIIDRITSVLQALVLAYTLIHCVDKKASVDKAKLLFMVFMFTLVGIVFADSFGNSPAIIVFLTHILSLGLVIVLYRKNMITALIAYTIVYCIIGIYTILFGNIFFAYAKEYLPLKYISYAKVSIIYFPGWILMFLCFKYIKKIEQVYKLIINERLFVYTIITSFAIDFVITFYILTLGDKSQLIKNIIYIMFFISFIVVLLYFGKVHRKSGRIYKLNKILEVKNNELRKIKHDYGAQISYLYGLCLMERFDDLKKSLKDIINNNESIPTAVEVTQDENSLLSLALKPAINTGIHVIIEENYDVALVNMNDMEFYMVLSNIVNNAIKAMNGNGIIIAKSYEYLGNVVIKIENNGPKIPEYHLQEIFKMGFTTKENNNENHGYGLNIAKDLIEKYNGRIDVKSTDISTEFKIILPLHNL